MRIKLFSKFITNESEDYKLQNSEVVIDGQNFFYRLYNISGLRSKFGCESDKYAQYLRRCLNKFKEANIKCYFFFKGGHEEPSSMWDKYNKDERRVQIVDKASNFYGSLRPLIFTKEIYKQVLEEMGFDYVICEFEAKRECIAFAQKRNCPIISDDIEFCFSGVPYICVQTNTLPNIPQCKIFILDKFMRKFRLNEEKLAVFVVLTDEYKFPKDYFKNFLVALKITSDNNYIRNRAILKWLSVVGSQYALNRINQYVTPRDRTTVSEKYREVKAFIRRQERPGLPSQYLENQINLQFVENDPQWFEKGIVTKAVAIPYINLYRWSVAPASWAIADNGAADPLLLSLDIIKYAFGLLCDFRKIEFEFVHETFAGTLEKKAIEIPSNFCKPNYSAVESPFENGWSQVRSLGLFEHFLVKTLPNVDFTILEKLPKDARLLFIALVYFSHKKPESTINEVCSVLLSYLVLNVLSEVECEDCVNIDVATGPILDATKEEDSIVHEDKLVARRNLDEYVNKLAKDEEKNIFDCQRIHNMVEFQHCLEHLNFLNRLCAQPYQPTVYSKTFNGTLVHKILFSLETQAVSALSFFENLLKRAPTVFDFWNRLIGAYKEMI